MAVRAKKDSSLAVGMRLVKEGRAQAFASAGNSGAIMAAALFGLGRIPGVERPALGSLYPATPCRCLLIDAGANTATAGRNTCCSLPSWGTPTPRVMFGLHSPSVGIVSNGEEAGKGSMLVRDAGALLSASALNFVGNLEGKDIGKGAANVVVTDGMTGKRDLKLSEGLVSYLARTLKNQNSPAAGATSSPSP